MSDYYGIATLESWLENEVFTTSNIPEEVVKLFERWRGPIESSVTSWMDSDDGDGNHLSWRGWGRGYENIPDGDGRAFDEAVDAGKVILDARHKSALEKSLTTRAFAMAENTPLIGEEYDMITELAERVVELERRAALAIELRNAGMPGFVEAALNGEDVRTNRLVRECLDNIKKLDDMQRSKY